MYYHSDVGGDNRNSPHHYFRSSDHQFNRPSPISTPWPVTRKPESLVKVRDGQHALRIGKALVTAPPNTSHPIHVQIETPIHLGRFRLGLHLPRVVSLLQARANRKKSTPNSTQLGRIRSLYNSRVTNPPILAGPVKHSRRKHTHRQK